MKKHSLLILNPKGNDFTLEFCYKLYEIFNISIQVNHIPFGSIIKLSKEF